MRPPFPPLCNKVDIAGKPLHLSHYSPMRGLTTLGGRPLPQAINPPSSRTSWPHLGEMLARRGVMFTPSLFSLPPARYPARPVIGCGERNKGRFSGHGIFRCEIQKYSTHTHGLQRYAECKITTQRPKETAQAMFLWLNAHFEPFLHDGRVQLIGQSGFPPAKILNFL